MRLTGTLVLREEIHLIQRMDRAYLNKQAELSKKEQPKNQQFISDYPRQTDPVLASRSEKTLSTELFDSMF